MAPGSHITCRSLCINIPGNPAGGLDELAIAQGSARKFNAGSDEAFIIVPIFLETPTSFLIPPTSKDLFIKFLKVFMEMTQAPDQEQLELQERPLKARTPEIYFGKFHMDCYHFCQQCKNYFKTLGATGMNCTPFTATFFCGSINLR